jgi:hypothetical protein
MKPKGKPVKWSSIIAYIVGLLTTDGNLSPDGRHLTIISKDISLLKTFKKCLGLKNKIGLRRSGYTGKKDCHHVQFGNVILYKWLLNIGLMPNKTKIVGTLKIPNQYFFDFLRGHLDGDGDIRRYQDPIYPNSERLYIRFCSASLEHIRWLQNRIKSLLKIKGYITQGDRISYLRFAKNDSLILLPCLYPKEDVPCLQRKYKIVKNLLNNRAEVMKLENMRGSEPRALKACGFKSRPRHQNSIFYFVPCPNRF